MSYVKIIVHAVWGTKNRFPYLKAEAKSIILNHIKENARVKKLYVDVINSHLDHIHCLFYLNKDINIAKVIQLLKGESSFWINKQKLFKSNFEWADEYFAVSVSESQIEKVRAYILNQEQHHKKKTFEEEYKEFIDAYKFDKG